MQKNIFFKKKNIKIQKLCPNHYFKKNFIINDVKPLEKAKIFDITFFDSLNYVDLAKKNKSQSLYYY